MFIKARHLEVGRVMVHVPKFVSGALSKFFKDSILQFQNLRYYFDFVHCSTRLILPMHMIHDTIDISIHQAPFCTLDFVVPRTSWSVQYITPFFSFVVTCLLKYFKYPIFEFEKQLFTQRFCLLRHLKRVDDKSCVRGRPGLL